jgi:EasF-like predicted methyltransferase
MGMTDHTSNLRKVKILLDALDAAEKNVSYFALDLMQSELARTLAVVPEGTFKHVKCFGLWGTYDDGLDWLKREENASRPKTILSMGSSIGNFPREEAAKFVHQVASILGPADTFIIGLDACQNPDRVQVAYNDHSGITHQFTLNGLKHANELLGYEAFRLGDWVAIGRYDKQGGKHQAFVAPRSDVMIEGVAVRKDEELRIEESYKYSLAQSEQLWRDAGVIEGSNWSNTAGDYSKHAFTLPEDKRTTNIADLLKLCTCSIGQPCFP